MSVKTFYFQSYLQSPDFLANVGNSNFGMVTLVTKEKCVKGGFKFCQHQKEHNERKNKNYLHEAKGGSVSSQGSAKAEKIDETTPNRSYTDK